MAQSGIKTASQPQRVLVTYFGYFSIITVTMLLVKQELV